MKIYPEKNRIKRPLLDKSNLIFFCLILVFIGLVFWGLQEKSQTQKNSQTQPEINTAQAKSLSASNMLAIGDLAKEETVEIAVKPLMEFDFLSKAQVLKLRTDAVNSYPQLLAQEYKPSEAVFGQIVDGVPWWGIMGVSYYGRGEKSIEGPSLQSLSILNPFLLVVPEIIIAWDPQSVSVDQLASSEHPINCPPLYLRWYPKAKRAEAGFDFSCATKSYKSSFQLVAYNARDFLLPYIFISDKESLNILQINRPSEAFSIPHFIHRGSSCGYPGGCNNVSPAHPSLDTIVITGYPAKLVVLLWHVKPESVEHPPDMEFVIDFK